MIRRAIREGWGQRWGIQPEWMTKLPQRMARIVADPQSKNRDAIGAMNTLRAMRADNHAQDMDVLRVLEGDTAQPAPGVTVNVGIVNAPQVRALAMDPAKFDQFAALAESIQTGGTGNSNNGAATPNGTGTH